MTRTRPHRGRPLALVALEDRTVPTTFVVSTPADSGPGSLRQAVLDANAHTGSDTITFADSVHRINLSRGELLVSDDLTVLGPGITGLSVSGKDASRVFDVSAGTVSISGLTVTHGLANGQAPGTPASGGGIVVRSGASVSLADVAFTNNKAVGDKAVTVPLSAVFNIVGGAGGGAVANFGTLSVTGSVFTGNQAVGADHADSSDTQFPGPAFPGNAFGGALNNFGTAAVAGSTFVGNTAKAGSFGKGDFAAIASGGAVCNDADLTVTGSTFSKNQALAGSNATSASHVGHALGGALTTGSLAPLAGGSAASLTVSQSVFDHNQAVGGNDNTASQQAPPAPADGPDNAYGGAILVYEGTATIGQTWVHDNLAQAGAGGAAQNGSLGVGGGIFFFNFLGGTTGTVDGCVISHNAAVGGAGRSGQAGGDGLGGGIAAGGLGASFGQPGTVTVNDTLIAGNTAQGGAGGKGGAGGNGLGGGIYVGADDTMNANGVAITANQAKLGKGKGGGKAGQGLGGGVYNLGTFTADATTTVTGNKADSGSPDTGP